jgi:hypothetical protein
MILVELFFLLSFVHVKFKTKKHLWMIKPPLYVLTRRKTQKNHHKWMYKIKLK